MIGYVLIDITGWNSHQYCIVLVARMRGEE
jgi:hypothetical protein